MSSRKFKHRPLRLSEVFQRYDPPVYFVTFCTYRRRSLLASDRTHVAFVEFGRRASNFNIAVGRYVLMPDHVHLFVSGDEGFVLGRWVGVETSSCSRQQLVQVQRTTLAGRIL